MSDGGGIRDWLDEAAPGAIVWDDCDAAIVGLGMRCSSEPVVVYDYDLLVDCFVQGGMDHEDAEEWVQFNILGAYVGERTPIVLTRHAPLPL